MEELLVVKKEMQKWMESRNYKWGEGQKLYQKAQITLQKCQIAVCHQQWLDPATKQKEHWNIIWESLQNFAEELQTLLERIPFPTTQTRY